MQHGQVAFSAGGVRGLCDELPGFVWQRPAQACRLAAGKGQIHAARVHGHQKEVAARGGAAEGAGQWQEDACLHAQLLTHLAQRRLTRGLSRVGPTLGKAPDVAAEVACHLAQQQAALWVHHHTAKGTGLAHGVLLWPGQARPAGGFRLGKVFFQPVQGAPDLAVALGPGLARGQGHVVLEVGVTDVGHDARQRLGEFLLGAAHAPGVVGARVGFRRAGLGQVMAPQALKVAACAAANGQVGPVRLADDAEEAEGGEKPHVRGVRVRSGRLMLNNGESKERCRGAFAPCGAGMLSAR